MRYGSVVVLVVAAVTAASAMTVVAAADQTTAPGADAPLADRASDETPGRLGAADLGADGRRRQTRATAPPIGWGLETVYGTEDLVRPGGGEGVTVAVVDTGVDVDHPDLRRRIAACRDTTDGRVVRGSCRDDVGHGTGVAGVVAADGGAGGDGLWGVAPAARILAYRACDSRDACRQDGIDAAILDAVESGADIVVLGLGNDVPQGLEAVDDATADGALVVAAAGNRGPDLDSIVYPAGDPDVVGVGAVAHDGDGVEPADHRVPAFSARGRQRDAFAERNGVLEVAAPGDDLVTTVPSGYGLRSGTSFAAPFVAGVAARLWPRVDDEGEPGKRDDVRRALQRRAAAFDVERGRHAAAGYDPAAGIGVPRARAPRPAIVVEPRVPTRGAPATLRAVDRSETRIDRYDWRFPASDDSATGARITHVFPRHGEILVELRATARDGTVVAAERRVRVNAPPTARFGHAPPVPLVGAAVTLDGRNASDSDGRIVRHRWDVDGDGATDLRGVVATTRFRRPGPHDVALRVTDDDGASAATNRTVLVNDRPSITNVTPRRVRAGEPVRFRATVTDEVGEVTVRWRFPEGVRSDGGHVAEGRNVTVTLPAGRHTVHVTATDEYGARSNRTVAVEAETAGSPGADGALGDLSLGSGLSTLAALLALFLFAAWRRRR